MKTRRQETICDIIREHPVDTQGALCELLQEKGFAVTQTTVSRDIKELQLVKVPSGDGGYKYTLPGAALDTEKYTDVFRKNLVSVVFSHDFLVVRTNAGAALLTAQAIDALGYSGCLGTVAGYDTVFVATDSQEHAQKLCGELTKYTD